MKKFILFICLAFSFFCTKAQQAAVVDSIKHQLAKATTAKEKVYWLDNLSRTLIMLKLRGIFSKKQDEYT